MKTVILDTETNGLLEHEIIELAYIPIDVECSEVVIMGEAFERRYKPQGKIQTGASLVHGIIDEDLDGCPDSSVAVSDLPVGLEYMIAHKAQYDWNSLGQPDVKTICTLAIAQSLYPELHSHKQGVCFLEFYGKTRENLERVRANAHGAMADISMLMVVLKYMLEDRASHVETIEDLYDLSEVCRVPKAMPFGKHRGVAIKDIPHDYLRWMINTLKEDADADPYLLKALRDARGEHFKKKARSKKSKGLFD
jgi:exodeoxyribonuclease X